MKKELQILIQRKNIEKEFVKELRMRLEENQRVYKKEYRKKSISKFLQVANFSDFSTEWSITDKGWTNSGSLSVEAETLLQKIDHMLGCGHSWIKDVLEMLRKIGTSKRPYVGLKGRTNSELGYFKWNWKTWNLRDDERECIRIFIKDETILSVK